VHSADFTSFKCQNADKNGKDEANKDTSTNVAQTDRSVSD